MQTVLSTRLVVLIGPKVPTPAPAWLMEAFESAEVTARERERSGFQLTFRAGRSGPLGLPDYRLLQSDLLRAGARVILMVIVGGRPHVLIDGLITQQELPIESRPSAGTLTLTGEDLSCAMDRKEEQRTFTNLSEGNIARKIILNYANLGITPMVRAEGRGPGNQNDGQRVQRGTDYDYLQNLARQNGLVFHIEPGPAPGFSFAYWGPQKRDSAPQRALSVNMGPGSNVESLNFRYDGLAAEKVGGRHIDRDTGAEMQIPAVQPGGRTPLAVRPALVADAGITRETLLRVSGATASEAMDLARARSSASTERVVVGSGELDTTRYGDVLKPYGVVGVRGAGFSFNGTYVVHEVRHVIRSGSYRQHFSLSREGSGSTVAAAKS